MIFSGRDYPDPGTCFSRAAAAPTWIRIVLKVSDLPEVIAELREAGLRAGRTPLGDFRLGITNGPGASRGLADSIRLPARVPAPQWALAARGGDAVGTDADHRMLVAALARTPDLGGRCAFVAGRLEHLPFPDGVFDVVVAVTVLCFVPDASLAVREALRVLRPGGRLVIGELGRWNLWAALRRIRAWLGSQRWKSARFRSASELRSLLARAGIAVTAVRGAVYYPPVGWVARIVAPADRWLSGWTTIGGAFILIAGTKRGP